jgi:hypothetical protein
MVDAVMYLVRTLTLRGKQLTLAMLVRDHRDPVVAKQAMLEALPEAVRGLLEERELESIRARFAAAVTLPDRPRLRGSDFVGALGIFLIVVATTFPWRFRSSSSPTERRRSSFRASSRSRCSSAAASRWAATPGGAAGRPERRSRASVSS